MPRTTQFQTKAASLGWPLLSLLLHTLISACYPRMTYLKAILSGLFNSYLLCFEHVDNLGEPTVPPRRPAFSLENNCGKWWVKQLPSALELPCARVVGAASPNSA